MDKEDIQDIAELKVRQYFDHFLEVTLPCILEKHTRSCVHGYKISRWKWMLVGITALFTFTGSVYGVVRVIQSLT